MIRFCYEVLLGHKSGGEFVGKRSLVLIVVNWLMSWSICVLFVDRRHGGGDGGAGDVW